MRRANREWYSSGFTLVGLVTVIVLLGVLSVGSSKFLGIGSQIYVDATNRDEIIATARFAVERLNREIRSALPNSVRVTENVGPTRQCIEYRPIITSAIYLDIPVAPEPATDIVTVVDFNDAGLTSSAKLAVYPLSSSDVYGAANKIHSLLSPLELTKSTHLWTLKLAAAKTFAEDSPTNRLYFIDSAVSFCVQNGKLTRHTEYGYDGDGMAEITVANPGVAMADDINTGAGFPFQVSAATQQRNATVLTKFTFTRNFESVTFNNEIQVPNVP